MPVSSSFFQTRRLFAVCALVLVARSAPVSAQDAALPFTPIQLDNLSEFEDPGENWVVAGDVVVDRRREGDLRPVPGTGVLVNRPTEEHAANLFTEMEHGDVELELDFLVPKGSNSGVYLMGRYEVQVLDSWGADPPRFSDAGGIYQRWDETRGEGRAGFEGHPPRINASRAPGLWQNLRIRFQAPRFDAGGSKTADARFIRVEHNGVVVQENITVTGPTRAAAFEDEQPMGPLMLQGDHGPVAYRNIRVKKYGGTPAHVAELRYRALVEPTLDITDATVHTEGESRAIAAYVAGDRDRFAMQYEGHFHAPASGEYLFDLGLGWVDTDPHFEGKQTGAARIYVGDDEVVRHEGHGPHAAGSVALDAGVHPFRLIFFKDRPWSAPRMTLHLEGPGFPRMPLHDPASLPAAEGVGAITVSAAAEPVVQRGFILHGDGKRTHAAAVGDPAGVHYAIDLASGALLYVWRGPFIETTPMWHERGSDQVALPLGSVVALDGGPPVAALTAPDAAWSAAGSDAAFDGYTLDGDGRPTFAFRLAGAPIDDVLRPSDEGRTLHRLLRIENGEGLTVRLAAGEDIVPADGGGYLVDGVHYVEPDPDITPTIRRVAGRHELVVTVPGGSTTDIGYTLIW